MDGTFYFQLAFATLALSGLPPAWMWSIGIWIGSWIGSVLCARFLRRRHPYEAYEAALVSLATLCSLVSFKKHRHLDTSIFCQSRQKPEVLHLV